MTTTDPRASRLLTVGLTGAVAAATVNAAIYGAGHGAGLDFLITTTSDGPQSVRLVDVVSFSLMAFGVGLVAALVATRVRRVSVRALQWLGVTVAVVSTAMDIPIDAAIPAKVTLASMHLVVGVAYVAYLEVARRGASRSTRRASRDVEMRTEALAA